MYRGATDAGRRHDVLLDARVRYPVGTEAMFLGEGERTVDGRVFPRRSATSRVLPQLGVTFRFWLRT